MDGMNVFYRAFLEYKKNTATDKNIGKLAEALLSAPTDDDVLEAVLLQCKIEEDWINIIETGLEHVEKAIQEERQFIRKEGEVVPIEKLKRVSTETVRHLAKHSNLITREPEPGEDVMPEKLYMAENLSDYAVYENRFLYMLLCYVRDFINVRLDRILESGKTCKITMNADKHTRVGKKLFKYKVSFYYEDKNDPLANTDQNDLIKRIETAQRLTVALLMTPLMREVSKAPMLSPPITRTNVLRMNVHFKAALEMYGQLTAYTKQGYELLEKKSVARPFTDACNSELVQTVLLQAFLAYKHGNKQEDALKKIYAQEEAEAFERHKQEVAAKLLAARQRLEEKQISPEEYILLQEERIKHLELDEQALRKAEVKITHLNERIAEQEADIKGLQENVETLNQTVLEKNELLKNQEREFAQKQREMEAEYQVRVRQLEAAHQEARNALETEYQERAKKFDEECQEARKVFHAEMEETRKGVELEKQEYIQAALAAREESQKADEERRLARAQLHGLRAQYNLIPETENYTTKEQFTELEKEFEAFEEFLKTQWKYTKKRIRRDILWTKPEKPPQQEESDEEKMVKKQTEKKSFFDKVKVKGIFEKFKGKKESQAQDTQTADVENVTEKREQNGKE